MIDINESLYDKGRMDALGFQTRSADMPSAEMYEEEDKIPLWSEAIKVMNMLNRHAGLSDGFVCKSPSGAIVRLIQNYDSDIFPQEPEELVAQYGFKWSTDPALAKPFISSSTSPYGVGECCIDNDAVYRSKIPNNVFAPSAYPQGWEVVNV